MPEEIIIRVDDDGNLTIEADGFKGDDCLKDLERIKMHLKTDFGVELTQEQQKRKKVSTSVSRSCSTHHDI